MPGSSRDQAEIQPEKKESDTSQLKEIEHREESPETKKLSEENLIASIAEFCKKQKVATMASNAFKNLSLSDTKIHIKLSNPVEVDAVESIKTDLLEYLRKVFATANLHLNYELNVDEASSTPYTPKEKFEAMMQKNPSLAKLKDVLGLDTDY